MAETLDVATLLPSKYEPKRKYRWIFMIEGIDAYLMKTAARPQMTFEETTIDWINTKRYLAGKGAFNPLSITMYDPIAPSGAQQTMEWLRLVYESVSGRGGYADHYKRDIQLKCLDPVGGVVEMWGLHGSWIQDANYGDLDYASSDAQEIALTLRFDNAVLSY